MAAWRFRVTRRLGYRQPVRRRSTGLFESIASASPLGHGDLTTISKQPSCRRPVCATVLAQAFRTGIAVLDQMKVAAGDSNPAPRVPPTR